MLQVNVANFITIGLMSVVAVVLVKTGFKALGKPSPV